MPILESHRRTDLLDFCLATAHDPYLGDWP